MFEDSKVVFITHPYYAVNNPTNNLRIYKKAKTLIIGDIFNANQKKSIELNLMNILQDFMNIQEIKIKLMLPLKVFQKLKVIHFLTISWVVKKQKK